MPGKAVNRGKPSNAEGPNAAIQPKQGSEGVTIREQGAKTENKGGLNIISRLNSSVHHTTSGNLGNTKSR